MWIKMNKRMKFVGCFKKLLYIYILTITISDIFLFEIITFIYGKVWCSVPYLVLD